MRENDRELPGPTSFDIAALRSIDSGHASLAAAEAAALRSRGWIDLNGERPRISQEGRVILERILVAEMLQLELR